VIPATTLSVKKRKNRKNQMKISRLCLLVSLALLCTGLAFADSIPDPKIIIRGVQGGGFAPLSHCPETGCTQVGMNFEFSVPNHGSGTLFFTNASGKNWTSLKLIETGVPAEAVTCAQSLFLSCTVRTLENGSVEILLSGVKGRHNPRAGIENGSNFSIGFACVDKNCWPAGLAFTAHASSAPEPGTIALMMTGVGAILSRRKRWKNALKA